MESMNLDPGQKKLLLAYEEVFGSLHPPLSCKTLVHMVLKLKPEFEITRGRRCPYPAPDEQGEEIERQIQECIDAGLVEWYKKGDYRHHCSPEARWTAVRLVVDYAEVIEVEAPGLSGLWNVRVPSTKMLLTEAHDVMSAVRAFWRVLYDKSLVQLGPATHWVWMQGVWAWGPVTTPTARALGF